MGCDIHIYPEMYNKEDNTWISAAIHLPCKGFSTSFKNEKEQIQYGTYMRYVPEENRNYTLFSILADVRSWGTGITPLKVGSWDNIPSDISEYTSYAHKNWNGNGHGAVCYTMEELVKAVKDTNKSLLQLTLTHGSNANQKIGLQTLKKFTDRYLDYFKQFFNHNMYWDVYFEGTIEDNLDKFRLIMWFDN